MSAKVVTIRSANRSSGTPEDFIITDNNSVFVTAPKSVRLSTVVLPYTWTNVNATSGNTMDFTGTNSGAHTIVLTTDNYDGPSLATALQTAMNLAAAPDVYTVVYNTTTNKYTITSTETFQIDFTAPLNMHVILGFPAIVTPLSNTATSTNVAGFVINKEVLICTNLISGIDNGIIDWRSGAPTDLHAIGFVPIAGCWGSIIEFLNPANLPDFVITNSDFSLENRSTSRNLRFWLAFPDGQIPDLAGQNWECTIILYF
jgi:hypothetical protein